MELSHLVEIFKMLTLDPLDLVALHHAGDPAYSPDGLGKWNQGIPIDNIIADMAKQNVSPFWDTPPPTD